MPKSNLSCSFCGKGPREVSKIFAGPTAYICNQCIERCEQIYDEQLGTLSERTLLTFIRDVLGGRPTDSITVGEFVRAYRVARAKLLAPATDVATESQPIQQPSPIAPLTPEELETLLQESKRFQLPSIDLSDNTVDPEAATLVAKQVCERHSIMPVACAHSTVVLAMTDPTNITAIDDVKFITACLVDPVLANERQIREAIVHYYK